MLFNKRETAEQAGTRVGWLSSMIGGSKQSAAGQLVTSQTALALPVLQNCVSLLAESVAQLPLEVFERLEDGSRKSADAHPAYALLKFAPNDWQTPFESREYAQTALGLRGNAYSFIERDGRGNPTALADMDLACLISDDQGALPSSDRQKLEGWAAHQAGIAAVLPSGHPYKLSPPLV